MLSDERIAELAWDASCACRGDEGQDAKLIESAIRTAMREAAEEAVRLCYELAPAPAGQYDYSFGDCDEAKADGCKECAAAIRARIEVPRNPR